MGKFECPLHVITIFKMMLIKHVVLLTSRMLVKHTLEMNFFFIIYKGPEVELIVKQRQKKFTVEIIDMIC